MSLTLLLDSNISVPAPAYLKKLAGFAAGWVELLNDPQELLASYVVDVVKYAFQ
jgi:hypothetical protein